mmetsp:Transcript_18908/g.31018  ORF Transcript_18908/g.31018 Transcript_18908/m.31018 type:complete len:732 (+) Transcript_18908:93-2288(+)
MLRTSSILAANALASLPPDTVLSQVCYPLSRVPAIIRRSSSASRSECVLRQRLPPCCNSSARQNAYNRVSQSPLQATSLYIIPTLRGSAHVPLYISRRHFSTPSPGSSSTTEQDKDKEKGDPPAAPNRTLTQKSVAAIKNAGATLYSAARIAVTDPTQVIIYLRKLWPAIKREAVHYWLGTKLLATQTSIAYRLLKRVLQGRELSRSERRILLTTAADLFRIVPLLVLVIVPFAELALPVILKIFPNFLPSTFQDKEKAEEQNKHLLKVRIELARVLQDTAEEMAVQVKEKGASKDKQSLAADFVTFMASVRKGEGVSNEDLIRFSKLFKDDLTLDSMPRPILVAMCKYMNLNIPMVSPDYILRFELRRTMKEIKKDDKEIFWEGGVDKLTSDELRTAVRVRGMRAIGLSRDALKRSMNRWLELSMTRDVPASLLILSRAFVITETEKPEEVLQAALTSMPETLEEQAAMETTGAAVGATTDVDLTRAKLDTLRKAKEIIIATEERSKHDAAAIEKAAATSIQTPAVIAAEEQGSVVDVTKDHRLSLSDTTALEGIGLHNLPKALASAQQSIAAAVVAKEIREERRELDELEVMAHQLAVQADVIEADPKLKTLNQKVVSMVESLKAQLAIVEKQQQLAWAGLQLGVDTEHLIKKSNPSPSSPPSSTPTPQSSTSTSPRSSDAFPPSSAAAKEDQETDFVPPKIEIPPITLPPPSSLPLPPNGQSGNRPTI